MLATKYWVPFEGQLAELKFCAQSKLLPIKSRKIEASCYIRMSLKIKKALLFMALFISVNVAARLLKLDDTSGLSCQNLFLFQAKNVSLGYPITGIAQRSFA